MKKLKYLVPLICFVGLSIFLLYRVVNYFPDYQNEARVWFDQEMNLDLNFSSSRISWGILGPIVVFENATITTKDSFSLISESEISFALSFKSFVIDRLLKIKTIFIDGANFSIIRSIDGELQLLEYSYYEDSIININQDNISLFEIIFTNSSISIKDELSNSSWEIFGDRFKLVVENNNIHLEAIAILSSQLNSRIDVSIDGEIFSRDNTSERYWSFFAQLRDIDLSIFSNFYPQNKGLPISGLGNLSLWLDLNGGQVALGTANLELNNVIFPSHENVKENIFYESFSLTMEWAKEVNGWFLALSNFDINNIEYTWPNDSFININLEEIDTVGTFIEIDSQLIRLDDLLPLSNLFADSDFSKLYNEYSPSGNTSTFNMSWLVNENAPDYLMSGSFENFSVNQVDDFFGVNNFTGRIRVSPSNGQINLLSDDMTIHWPSHFKNEVLINKATGLLVWRKSSDGYRILSDNLELYFPGVFSKSNLEITLPINNSSPYIDLELNIHDSDLKKIMDILPNYLYSNNFISSFDSIFSSFFLNELSLIYNGDLQKNILNSVYDDFHLSADFDGGLINFFDNSFRLSDIEGEIDIEENEIDLLAKAKFNNIDINNINGTIEFSKGRFYSENLSMEALDQLIDFSISSYSDDSGSNFDSSILLPANFFLENRGISFLSYIKGHPLININFNLPVGLEKESLRNYKMNISSNLSNTYLNFPEPFSKGSDEIREFDSDFTFNKEGRLEVQGYYDDNRFALSFWSDENGFTFRRGAINLDGSYPLMPSQNSLAILGDVDFLNFDDWISLYRKNNLGSNSVNIPIDIKLQIGKLSLFGQEIEEASLEAIRNQENWRIYFESEPINGQVLVHHDPVMINKVDIDLENLFWELGESRELDPSVFPSSKIKVNNFIIAGRKFGNLSAQVSSVPSGINLTSFITNSSSFKSEGSGSWIKDYNGHFSNLSFSLNSNDVSSTLNNFSIDELIISKEMQLEANLSWPGKPLSILNSDQINGELSLSLDEGTVLDIDPGATRMVGLFSIIALPRRLALDFSDVFNAGLAFDQISGNFILDEGNAYTDNLKLAGPVVDIGIIGRTGLFDRDYQQQAVVTSEPGNLLPTMGFLAGPGVGTAMLIFSQIFKEPLSGIGTASYCLSGSWEDPLIERLTFEEGTDKDFCADLLPEQI